MKSAPCLYIQDEAHFSHCNLAHDTLRTTHSLCLTLSLFLMSLCSACKESPVDSILEGKCLFIGRLSIQHGTLFICLTGSKVPIKVKLGSTAVFQFSLFNFVYLI